MNKKHEELITNVRESVIGSEDAPTIFFEGRFYEDDVRSQLVSAIRERRRFCLRIGQEFCDKNQFDKCDHWSAMAEQWNTALNNVLGDK